jgi:ADP-ribose pyrophosphatase
MSQSGHGHRPANSGEIVDIALLGSEEHDGGKYLRFRRVHLQNLRADGTRSDPYFCEFSDRPRHGTDAVAVALWRRGAGGEVEVLLRRGLRPTLRFGRPVERLAQPDAAPYLHLTEVVAGILEDGDLGEDGIRRRAALEAWEEAGLRVEPGAIRLLGRVFLSPGMSPECCYLATAEVGQQQAVLPEGDGSPMEEGSRQRFVPLVEAIALCDRGEIEDAKTEVLLRRLAAQLATPSSPRQTA